MKQQQQSLLINLHPPSNLAAVSCLSVNTEPVGVLC